MQYGTPIVNGVARAALLGALLLAAGCQKASTSSGQSAQEQAKASQGGVAEGQEVPVDAPAGALEDPAIASAVEQAAKAAARGASTAGAADQPPEDGKLGPHRADAEAKVGSAPQLTMASRGNEPQIVLGAASIPEKRAGMLEIGVRTGPRAMMPTVQLALEVSQRAVQDRPEAATGEQEWKVDLVRSELARTQPGQVPDSAIDAISKLKASELRFPLLRDWVLGLPSVRLSKAAPEDLDLLLVTIGDTLSTLFTVLPTEPVGKDAMWMVTSRESFMGSDVVAYRLYRVTEIDATGAVLEVNTKRYLASGMLGMPGLQAHEVAQFQGVDEAQIKVRVGERFPIEGRMVQRLGAVVHAPGDPEQQAPVQIEARSLFTFSPQPSAAVPGAGTTQTVAAPKPALAPPAASP